MKTLTRFLAIFAFALLFLGIGNSGLFAQSRPQKPTTGTDKKNQRPTPKTEEELKKEEEERKRKEEEKMPVICPNCKRPNEYDSEVCSFCNMALSQKRMVKDYSQFEESSFPIH